jgi:serine phosphatase RsbU (regulator of sigma subunit)
MTAAVGEQSPSVRTIEVLEERVRSQEAMLRSTMDYMSEVQRKLEAQKAELERKNREIMDSVHYARIIQDALLPEPEVLSAFSDHFILHRQRDIIGGDFPFVKEVHGKVYFAAIDCVGHGIPGAMLSSMVHYALNEILLRNGTTELRQVVAGAFDLIRGNMSSSGSRPMGFDIAMCSLDRETGKLWFCGAGRPMLVVRKGETQLIKGDRFGMTMHDSPRVGSQEVAVQKGDRVFLFSDGYCDQFGGPDDRKFSSARLRELLRSTSQLNMRKQREVINDVLMDWKRDTEQTDDILIMGVRI